MTESEIDPHDYLRNPDDKLVGWLLRTTNPVHPYDEDFLLCIATGSIGPYFNDMSERGIPELLIWTPGIDECSCSFGGGPPDSDDKSLAYLQEHGGLNLWQINKLFGFDGASKDLPDHIAKLVAALPPDTSDSYEANEDN